MFYLSLILTPLYFIFITFIPGFLLITYLNLRTNLFSLICYCLVVSFLINYLIIFILVTSGLYSSHLIFLYLLINLIILYLYKPYLKHNLITTIVNTKEKLRSLIFQITLEKKIIFVLISLLFFLILQNIYFDINDRNEGLLQTFQMQDVVYQYDHWSKMYFEGIFPPTTSLRPHLFPANLSYFYILVGSKFYEFVPILFLSLIPIYFIFGSLSYSMISNNINFLPPAFASIIILYEYTSGQAFSGHLEVPLSLWLFIIFLFLSEFYNSIFEDKRKLFIFFLLVTSCALIKELAWISLCIIILFLFFQNRKLLPKIFKDLLILFFLFLLVFISFYFFQNLKYGLTSNIEFLVKLFSYDSEFYLQDHKFDKDLLNLYTRISYGINNLPKILIIPLLATIFLYNKNNIFKYFILSTYAQIFFWISFTPFYTNYLFLSYFFIFSFGYFVLLENFIKFFKYKNFNYIFLILFFVILVTSLTNKIENKRDLLQKISEKKVKLNFNNKSFKQINNYFLKNILNGNLNEKILTNYPKIYSKDISIFNDVFIYTNNFLETKNNKLNIKYFFLYKNCNSENLTKINFKMIKIFESNSCLVKIIRDDLS